ncbi:hypothetical protein SLE2022_060460 [Rubroshorea leprosula]
MIPNPAALTRKSALLYRLVDYARRPVSSYSGSHARLFTKPIQIGRFEGFSSGCSNSYSLNSSHGARLNDVGAFKMGREQLGLDSFRVSAVSGGGSGGTGGFRGSGGGNSGDGSKGADGSGGRRWSFLSWYLDLLAKYPVLTKAITSALLTLIGDLICQLAIDQVPSLDVKRTFLFTLLGMVLVGPTLHFWYLYLSKLVTLPGASGAFLRLVLDQFIFSPIFIGVFLATLMTLEGKPEQVVPKLEQEWFSAVLANWQLWIPFQFLNFRYVPQQFQVLAANFIALIWNVILSFKAHKEVLPK